MDHREQTQQLGKNARCLIGFYGLDRGNLRDCRPSGTKCEMIPWIKSAQPVADSVASLRRAQKSRDSVFSRNRCCDQIIRIAATDSPVRPTLTIERYHDETRYEVGKICVQINRRILRKQLSLDAAANKLARVANNI